MRVAFFASDRLSASALDDMPLGGSESAMLTAARELARRGSQVQVISGGAPHGEAAHGVTLHDLDAALSGALPEVDILVSLNRLVSPALLARYAQRRVRYLHWHQNDARSAYAKRFADPRFFAHVDGFVFVSQTQMAGFVERFPIRRDLCSVISNPIAAPFGAVFDTHEAMAAAKDPDLLIYASAPNRGLDVLLWRVWPRLRARRESLRLEVYSGFQFDQGRGYRQSDGRSTNVQMQYLLESCSRAENVQLKRGVSKNVLAARMRAASVLCYPCHYYETCCVTALEAMAAGCLVITTPIGALPETTAGFAALVPLPKRGDWDAFADAFAARVLGALDARDRDPGLEARLRRQAAHVRARHSPAVVGESWARLLARETAQVSTRAPRMR